MYVLCHVINGNHIYMLFAGSEVRIVKKCDRGLENAFSWLRSQFFTIQTDLKPVNNLFIFFQALRRKKNSCKRYCDRGQRKENPDHSKNQSDCRICYRARLEKNKLSQLLLANQSLIV